jgi:hypothetical protein
VALVVYCFVRTAKDKNRSFKMGKAYNFGKREREKARQQKQMDKTAKRIMTKQQKADLKAGIPNAESAIAEPESMEGNFITPTSI